MSKCSTCNEEFTFFDVLKGFNPARIKCGDCSALIESSYVVLGLALILFAVLSFLFWMSPYSGDEITGMPMLIFMGSLGLVFEYGYFFLLKKGLIRSNLVQK